MPLPVPAPARKARIPSWVVTGSLAALIGILFVAKVGSAGGLVFGFLLLTPIERIWKRHDQQIRRPGLRTDMFHLLLTPALTAVGLVVPIVVWTIVLLPMRGNPLATTFNALPVVPKAVLAFVVFEILGYCAHRLEHELPSLWRFHAVHHSSTRLDWISGARAHPMEGLVVGSIIAAPALLLGVGPGTLGAFTVITQLWGVVLHMNVRWRMRWLDGIWSSTDYHHWHHSNHLEARNKNYSGFLPVIDKIFGTYYMPKHRRPEVYGIDAPMPASWTQQMLHPFSSRSKAPPATVVWPRTDPRDIIHHPLGG
ncbi:MAG: sterol desaturase family protein [Actinobacteria bacterium]|nr:sterol desaturase family protein [Actinomycetota bacterium]